MLEQYLRVKPVQISHDRNSHLSKQETFIMTILATNLEKIVHFWNIFPKKPENSRTQIEKICAKQEGVLLRLQFLGALDTRIWKNAVDTKKTRLAGEKRTIFRLPTQSLKYKI